MITRRNLLKQVGLLSAGTFLLKDSFAFDVKNKKVGVQLYTVRDQIFKDPKGVLRKIAALGYGEVENFGYGNGKFFGMSAQEYKSVLTELKLESPSGHYMYTSIQNGWEQAVADAKTIGQKYMVLAYLLPTERKTIADYKKIAADLNAAGAVCKKAGIQLCYHNHDFEFETLEGQTPYDILVNETDKDLVKFEVDLYWASRAGKDPIALFKKMSGRIALWHVKDMAKTETKEFTEVGNGSINFATIFSNAKLSGMKHFFVEQDVCPADPMVSIEKSIKYIQSNLVNLL